MAARWTLPLLQERLDELPPGADFALDSADMIRLFGINDAGVRRIGHFAIGHRCDVVYSPAGVLFRKCLPRPETATCAIQPAPAADKKETASQ